MVWADSSWFERIWADLSWFELIWANLSWFSWFQLVSADCSWFQLFSADISWFQLISADFSWFQLISADFSWFQLISAVFSWFQLFSAVFSCFQLTRSQLWRLFCFKIWNQKFAKSETKIWILRICGFRFWSKNLDHKKKSKNKGHRRCSRVVQVFGFKIWNHKFAILKFLVSDFEAKTPFELASKLSSAQLRPAPLSSAQISSNQLKSAQISWN